MARRLLLADDSITIQKVVELVLAEEDFEIKSLANGEDALKAMDSFVPDIILADIDMPKVNGYQLCEKIKQNPRTAGIPVILLAGAFEPIDDELAARVGADDSVIKPFESQELISKINSALTMASANSNGGDAFAAAEEESIELIEEAEAVEAEAAVSGAEEDLWAMEDIAGEALEPEAAAVTGDEAGLDDAFEISEETFAEAPEPARVADAGPQSRPRADFSARDFSMPGGGEVLKIFENAVRARVEDVMSGSEIKESITAALAPAIKDSVEKVLWEIAPDMVQKMLQDVLRQSVSQISSQIEKIIWETVPDLASNLISKEIEKIKAEF